MKAQQHETQVVIIGGGVAGLTLGTFLKQSGISCIILERCERNYIESTRQRAGAVEARAVQMFERWGLADKVLGGVVAQTIEYRINGHGRVFDTASEDGSPGRFCTQQMLVNSLMRELIDNQKVDVRFGVNEIAIHNGENPTVNFSDANGAHELRCTYIVGCDGSRSVSRASIPQGILSETTHDFGYSWLAALVETPLVGHPIMGVSDRGFVAQLPRGPQRSRYYLQCAPTDRPEDWSNERIWNEIRLRVGNQDLPDAKVLDRLIVPLRSVVYAPMRYQNLFLAGDAAHLVPPTGAKGMNLALYDVDVLAQGLVKDFKNSDASGLNSYSEDCLRRIWNYQEFSVWMTETMHDAGDATKNGKFRQMIARARLETLFTSATAARLHSDFLRGMI